MACGPRPQTNARRTRTLARIRKSPGTCSRRRPDDARKRRDTRRSTFPSPPMQCPVSLPLYVNMLSACCSLCRLTRRISVSSLNTVATHKLHFASCELRLLSLPMRRKPGPASRITIASDAGESAAPYKPHDRRKPARWQPNPLRLAHKNLKTF